MSAHPDILLVTVDSLRADHVYSGHADTPALDDIADGGTVFEQAIAQGPFTTFSMPSLFTSRYPSQLTSIDFVEGVEGVLIDGEPTIQQRLAEAGYTTAGIHSNPLLSDLFGFDVGLDYFYDGVTGLADRVPGRVGLLANKLQRLARKHAYVPAEDLTDRAVNWLRGTTDGPIFLWVHYMDVHGPYQSKSGFSYLEKYRAELLWRKAVHRPREITADERRRLRETYREEVEYTDAAIGRLVDAFRRTVDDDSLIAVTADHGDEFGEHGSYSHEAKLYDELVHVPLLVEPPADVSVPDGRQSEPVPLLDVGATLADAAGGVTNSFEGTTLLDSRPEPEWPSETPEVIAPSSARVVTEARLEPDYVGAIRTRNWKYVRTGDDRELYDLAADGGETDDIAEERSDVADAFERLLAVHRDRHSGARRDDEALSSDELDDQLRSLGYLE